MRDGPEPPDLTRVSRTIARPPRLLTEDARYGLFRVGPNAGLSAWAILDRRAPGRGAYEVLYLDLDTDGDLTEPGERFESEFTRLQDAPEALCRFTVGEWQVPGEPSPHQDVALYWLESGTVRYQLSWRGVHRLRGGYGADPCDALRFGPSPDEAPVLVAAGDLPLEFQAWRVRDLRRDDPLEIAFFVGHRGLGTGTFTAVDNSFLGRREDLRATLFYTDVYGQERYTDARLGERCCSVLHAGRLRVPTKARPGAARLVVELAPGTRRRCVPLELAVTIE